MDTLNITTLDAKEYSIARNKLRTKLKPISLRRVMKNCSQTRRQLDPRQGASGHSWNWNNIYLFDRTGHIAKNYGNLRNKRAATAAVRESARQQQQQTARTAGKKGHNIRQCCREMGNATTAARKVTSPENTTNRRNMNKNRRVLL